MGNQCPVYIAKKEIEDLQSILPDMLAKIEDTEDEMRGCEKKEKMTKDCLSNKESETIGFGSKDSSTDKAKDAAITSDISHMIRKKRKPEEVEETTKKSKIEGTAAKETVQNGDKA